MRNWEGQLCILKNTKPFIDAPYVFAETFHNRVWHNVIHVKQKCAIIACFKYLKIFCTLTAGVKHITAAYDLWQSIEFVALHANETHFYYSDAVATYTIAK